MRGGAGGPPQSDAERQQLLVVVGFVLLGALTTFLCIMLLS